LILGQQMQEVDGIEQIGFADAVWPRDAGKRAKANVDIQEILEPSNAETSQHGATTS
jgi:hypothetical protein